MEGEEGGEHVGREEERWGAGGGMGGQGQGVRQLLKLRAPVRANAPSCSYDQARVTPAPANKTVNDIRRGIKENAHVSHETPLNCCCYDGGVRWVWAIEGVAKKLCEGLELKKCRGGGGVGGEWVASADI
jgi:hypothetical protein